MTCSFGFMGMTVNGVMNAMIFLALAILCGIIAAIFSMSGRSAQTEHRQNGRIMTCAALGFLQVGVLWALVASTESMGRPFWCFIQTYYGVTIILSGFAAVMLGALMYRLR